MPKRDYLGLRAALADRMLPVLVAAMSFLAALALAGSLVSCPAMAWSMIAQSSTVQVIGPA